MSGLVVGAGAATGAPAAAVVTAVVTDGVVDRVADLLRSAVGLRQEPTLRARLRRCIRDEIADHGQDAESYLRALSAGTALR